MYNEMNKANKRNSLASLSQLEQSPETIEKLLAFLKRGKGIFTISGNCGCGKSYLANAVYNEWISDKMQCRFMYITDFLTDVKKQIETAGGDCSYRVKTLAESNWFILDDFGASNVTEWQKEIFEQFINERYDSMLPTIITTNLSERQIYDISPRIYSRLKDTSNVFITSLVADKRQQQPKEAQ